MLGFVLAWKRLTGLGSGTGIILSVSSITVILFLSALAGMLKTGSSLLWAAGAVSLCVFIWKGRAYPAKTPGPARGNMVCPGSAFPGNSP